MIERTHFDCHLARPGCEGYDVELDMADVTPETFTRLTAARDAHYDAHHEADQRNVHIRKGVNPRRIRTGNQFYKNRVQLSAAENGSQTLCGDPATVADMSWGETRHENGLSYVTCERCKAIRRAA